MSDSLLHPSSSPKNELRVFISSTFRDLQEERRHLVKKVFPEIRALCRERGVTFTDVDLRWGLTEEEALLGRVIRTCLEEIDKCRPYFIGMIGNRYGWTPELHEILMDPDLLARYPWIEDVAIDGASVTEMEFIHGVFDAPQVDGEYAFFYHRPGYLSEADDPVRLQSLLDRIHATGRPLRQFDSVDALGEEVREDLLSMIDSHWPRSEAPTALELERRAHAAFASSRIRAYIPNPLYLKEFTRWAADVGKPLVVSGESGLGKSSLAAYLVEYYRRKNPTALVIEHYVGASRTSGSAMATMRHVIEEIQERFGLDEPLPAKEEELERSFPNWLFRCEHLAAQEGIRVLIVLDAVNQLNESGRRLGWLPETIPSGIGLLVSTTPGRTADRLQERQWEQLVVKPVEDERVRQSIVIRYLGEFHKGISPEQLRRITSDPKASSPLYLRVVAEELRLHGEHETLDAAIARYIEAGDLLDLFGVVLERIESDYGIERVRETMSAIWASRTGLTEQELMEITGISRLDLSRLLFAIDYHFVQRQGALGFFHDYLRSAVQRRYLSDDEHLSRIRRKLADYFEGVAMTERTALELLWQYGSHGDPADSPELDAKLAATLSRPDLLVALYDTHGHFEMLERWARLSTKGFRVGEAYLRSLDESAGTPEAIRGRALASAASILSSIGEWQASDELFGRLAAFGRDHEQPADEAKGYLGLGELRWKRGEYADAMTHFQSCFGIASKLGDRRLMASVIGDIGLVHRDQGRFEEASEHLARMLSICEELGDRSGMSKAIAHLGTVRSHQGRNAEAMECFRRVEAISEELGDRHGMANAIGDMGVVYFYQGRYGEALESYRRQLEITREIGNRHGMSNTIGNIGMVYAKQGRFGDALECYRESIAIQEEIGDRQGMSIGFCNMGIMHANQGEHAESLECYKRCRSICEELGDPRGRSIAVGNMAGAYVDLGQNDRALECYAEAAEEHRGVGFRYGLTYWLENSARLLVTLTDAPEMPEYMAKHLPGATDESWRALALARARTYAEESRKISDDLGKPDTQMLARVILARIDAAEGSPDAALETLGSMLAGATDGEQCAEVSYWIWQIASRSKDPSDAEVHRANALRLYTDVYATIPKDEYRKRIDELQAAANAP